MRIARTPPGPNGDRTKFPSRSVKVRGNHEDVFIVLAKQAGVIDAAEYRKERTSVGRLPLPLRTVACELRVRGCGVVENP